MARGRGILDKSLWDEQIMLGSLAGPGFLHFVHFLHALKGLADSSDTPFLVGCG
jgi:hypothetical protein